MAQVLRPKKNSITDLPENITLEIFGYLRTKELCVIARVCRSWRRISKDFTLWQHVDLRPYKLNLHKMWKVIRAHFSDVLISLRIRGYMDRASVNWHQNSLSDAMLRELKDRCPNISELELVKTSMASVSSEHLPLRLESLSVTASHIPVGWFKAGSQSSQWLPRLVSLDLTASTKTSNSDLRDLHRLSGLVVLKLNGCYRITDEGLQLVADNFSDLETLEVSETTISDLAIHHIARKLWKLRRLNLALCVRLTDAALASIGASQRGLNWLEVGQCEALTDQGCAHLQAVASLRYCGMEGTNVTEVGRHELCLALRECDVTPR